MRTRRRDYDSPLDSVEESGGEVEDSSVPSVVLDDSSSVSNPPHLSDCPGTWGISSFDDIDDCVGGSAAVGDRYSGGPRAFHLPIGRRALNPGRGHRGSAIQSSTTGGHSSSRLHIWSTGLFSSMTPGTRSMRSNSWWWSCIGHSGWS